MSEDLHDPPHRRNSDAVCAHHARLADDLGEIKNGVKRIEATLNSGTVQFATLELRMAQLEKIVYGAVSVSLLALAGAVLALVLKRGGV